MTDLIVLVPSRGRPQNIADLLGSWDDTVRGPKTRLVVCVDDNDPTLPEYEDRLTEAWPIAQLWVGPQLRIAGTLNHVAPQMADLTFALGFMGDDHRPRTEGWDLRYIDALREMGTGLVYGNDLIMGGNLATQVAMTSDIVKTLGYMVCPGPKHLYLDNFWMSIGRGLDRIKYLDDVVIEHLHPAGGTAEWDDGYRWANAPQRYKSDERAFVAYRDGGGLEADLEKLRTLL